MYLPPFICGVIIARAWALIQRHHSIRMEQRNTVLYLQDFRSGNLVFEKYVIYYNRGKTNYVYLLKTLVLLIGKYNNLTVQHKLVLAGFLTSETPALLYSFHVLVGCNTCFLMYSMNAKSQWLSCHLVGDGEALSYSSSCSWYNVFSASAIKPTHGSVSEELAPNTL